MKFLGFSICSYKEITFGDFTAHQFVLFEHKKIGSIIFFYFKGEGWQDRYHTHAFNAVSFKIFGTYQEANLKLIKDGFLVNVKPRTEIIKFFPKNCYHALGNSNGCMTVLFSGPWGKTWKEMREDGEYELNWSRTNETRILSK